MKKSKFQEFKNRRTQISWCQFLFRLRVGFTVRMGGSSPQKLWNFGIWPNGRGQKLIEKHLDRNTKIECSKIWKKFLQSEIGWTLIIRKVNNSSSFDLEVGGWGEGEEGRKERLEWWRWRVDMCTVQTVHHTEYIIQSTWCTMPTIRCMARYYCTHSVPCTQCTELHHTPHRKNQKTHRVFAGQIEK